MVRMNPKNVGAKGKEKVTKGPSRKRARSGLGSSRPTVQPNPNEKPKRESIDDDRTTPEQEPHVDTASEKEAEVAAQESECDSDDGNSDHAPTGRNDEDDDDDQSAGTAGDADYLTSEDNE
ncbi:hypothetical protein K7X08_011652 [Anisodus acutangulus]|uniref:Uncharacterized protein n=1 Tax=Anisodus acutangulus TaxID=402998 RepID=A0A9Q1MN66_9SOLA|nr:hypothetical protein K7X08_011652 [Anisodus acutangulus]